jgi:hypothetical protein
MSEGSLQGHTLVWPVRLITGQPDLCKIILLKCDLWTGVMHMSIAHMLDIQVLDLMHLHELVCLC